MSTLSPEAARYLPIFKVWGDDEGKQPSVALDKQVCVIGRHESGVNLPLHAPQVSKLHALVVRTQGHVYVRDLASRNGVQRNGEPVQEVGLSDEDVLRIGSYTLRCAHGFGHAEDEEAVDDTGVPVAAAVESRLPPAELIGPDGATYPFPVGRHTLLIGQREGCEVRLTDDDKVSPVHAILFEIDGTRYVRDLGAPAGTFLNGQSIHQARLTPGDQIRVGGVVMRYALVDLTEEDEDAAATRDALGVDESAPGIPLLDSMADAEAAAAAPETSAPREAPAAPSTPVVDESAPGIDLVDSTAEATNPNAMTGDSLIAPEISMEDSHAPAPDRRPVAPISEYDMDVVDADPRRESTFAGEVVVGNGTNAMKPENAKGEDAKPQAVAPDEARPARPELPPKQPVTFKPRLDDSAIPIAGSFHDRILDDEHMMPAAAAEAPKTPGAPVQPTVEAPPTASKADDDSPAKEAVAEEITQLVEDVTERVAQVSEKVEIVAAKVERVAQKMSEVTVDVGDVAEKAETLQEAWTEYRNGETNGDPSPGSDQTPPGDTNGGRKRRRGRKPSRKSEKGPTNPDSPT
jgi:pSer/pThr/pTyr-binding forkhead associated (FHA) protein